MKTIVLVVIILALCIPAAWMIAVPSEFIVQAARDALQGSGISMDIQNFRKGPLLDFTSTLIELQKSGSDLLSVEHIQGRIIPLSLLRMRPRVGFSGMISNGTLHGTSDITGRRPNADIGISGSLIEGIPLLQRFGIKGSGSMSGTCTVRDGRAEFLFRIDDAQLEPYSYSGMTVPLNVFRTMKGSISLESGKVRITSFTMEGDGIFARLKGTGNAEMLNLTIELMPDASFKRSDMVWIPLEKYRVSPGFYSVPFSIRPAF